MFPCVNDVFLSLHYYWWIIRLLDYLLKCPKIQIGCFTGQIYHLKSLMELRIREPFVYHSTRTLIFVSWRKLGITSRDDLFVFLEELYSYSCFLEREGNIFLLEKPKYLSLWFFRERILTERVFTQRER